MSDTVKKYDIIVIGAGVVGGLIARSLSFYDADICLVDKHMDAAMGASGANSGIVHGGYDAKPGSLKARFNILGTSMMAETCKMLGVLHKNTGSLVIAFGPDDEKELDKLYENGVIGGIEGLELIDGEEARKLEPALNPTVT